MDDAYQALVVAIVFTALAALFLVLRCISRFLILKRPGAEDYSIVLAFVFSIGFTIIVALQRQNGLGKHEVDVPPEQVVTFMKLLYSIIPIYNGGMMAVKVSLLFQYLRFFVHRKYRLAAWSMMAFILIIGVILALVQMLSCRPVAYLWDKSISGTCMEAQPMWYTNAGVNLLTDIACLVLPIPVLLGLQLPKKQKISLILVFLLGGFGCIVSILRLHGIYLASLFRDLTYHNVLALIWTTVELNVGIMCACIPTIRPFMNLIFPAFLGSTRRGESLSNPFEPSPRSRGYYQRNDSTIELSRPTVVERQESDQISFDTVTKEPGIHVTHEWSIEERKPEVPPKMRAGTAV